MYMYNMLVKLKYTCEIMSKPKFQAVIGPYWYHPPLGLEPHMDKLQLTICNLHI
jgi:hypothetical protein